MIDCHENIVIYISATHNLRVYSNNGRFAYETVLTLQNTLTQNDTQVN